MECWRENGSRMHLVLVKTDFTLHFLKILISNTCQYLDFALTHVCTGLSLYPLKKSENLWTSGMKSVNHKLIFI